MDLIVYSVLLLMNKFNVVQYSGGLFPFRMSTTQLGSARPFIDINLAARP
jgi:hypothetical protein